MIRLGVECGEFAVFGPRHMRFGSGWRQALGMSHRLVLKLVFSYPKTKYSDSENKAYEAAVAEQADSIAAAWTQKG